MKSLETKPMDHKLVICSAVVLSALGALFYNLLPLFVGVAQDYRALSNQDIGLLGSAFFAGFTLTASTAFFWIRRVNWRAVSLLSLIVGCLALLLAGYSQSYALLMLSIFVAGGAFSTVYGIGTTLLSDTSNPARWYGLKISAEGLLGAILLFILPRTLIASNGFMGMMIGMVLAVLLLLPVLVWLPKAGVINHEVYAVRPKIPSRLRLAVWSGLFAVSTFMFSATMIWAFVERMASTAGIPPVLVGEILSLTLVFAVLGSLTAFVAGDRFGSGKPFVAATVLFLVALVWLSGALTVTGYAIGVCLLTFAIGMGISFVIAIVSDLDFDGRYVVLSVPALGVGVMAAPAMDGLLTISSGFSGIFMVAAISVVLSLIAAMFALFNGLPVVRRTEA